LQAIVSLPAGAWLRSLGVPTPGIGATPDASAHYRDAFKELSRLSRADDALIEGWKSAPLDDATQSLLRRASSALSALHRGAEIPDCTWAEVVRADSLNRGPLDVGNLQIGRVALLRARIRAGSGEGREALDDLFAAASYSRHVGLAGVLIARILHLSLENEAIAALGRILPKLDRRTLATIPGRIAALPTPCTWKRMMRAEARFIATTVAARIEAAPAPIGIEALTEAGLIPTEATAVFDATGGDRGQVLALVEGVIPYLEELADVLGLPLGASLAALEALNSRPETVNPFARSVVENADGIRYAVERVGVFWMMTRAALTRIVDGPDAFGAIADPFGDGPFSHQARGEGFELRSALHRAGMLPAVLVVGDC